MSDHHAHGHHHTKTNRKALFIAFLTIFGFMVVEAIGGWLTGSLALLSDAGHMFSDAAALFLSLTAMRIAARPPSAAKTYGYHRVEILAAFINGLTLAVISFAIFWEAYERIQQPPVIMSSGMLVVAVVGLIVNVMAAYVLMKGDTKGNLNVRSAFLHVVGDLFGSLGAITAGTLMLLFGWYWADPLVSALIAAFILWSGLRVLRDSVHVLMEGTPKHLSLQKLSDSLISLSGVKEVHDLHVWTVTSGFTALSCHLVVDEAVNSQRLLRTAKQVLHDEYGIEHCTLQLETGKLCDEENICERRRKPART